ncbi:outer membrane protein assembly factor BamD [Moraxella caviae]|uniref:Outer membrane protein assembly factor BamD n=1 Tax=Moraxella caviae TaxID=34060 RepID=A0A1T0A764_9GAMM|nr:outer membrane protein assembly factor BamD [Moraxella caviae]OOR91527.1 outer membrane protein assembly factor BamD [Moraxella caviae]STZ14388.1 outer membrane biogenesis protein BamD [Moraxella caviae]VEW10526.1 outer membrane biogenesis protein BamD [Moraxella caviae]
MKSFTTAKTATALLIAGSLALTGCSTLKNVVKKDDDVITTAEKPEAGYYQDAQNALEKERYREAIMALSNVRTFYPTGAYAQQALLDLIYAQFQANDFEAVTHSTSEFIRLYPTSPHLDYALYVQGVTNMGGSPKASRLIRLDQSQRDTAWLRLAFSDFQTLVNNFPNSPYAPDAAQRMVAIYNDFAEHELTAARWYIKRDAYLAAANRARWVFQYYPQSQSVGEAIAIMAYSYEQLGMTDTANQYKTLLQINHPNYLRSDGTVRLPNQGATSWGKRALSAATFGKFGRATDDTASYTGNYQGATKPQVIRQAGQLNLAPAAAQKDGEKTSAPARESSRRILGLGLPAQEAEAGHINDTP